MNRKQKIIISVTGIFIVMLILVGLTYAYFLTQITGNTNSTSISVETANLIIRYDDGTNIILDENTKLKPSSNAIGTKTFDVVNEGDEADYVVIVDNISIKNATTGESTTFKTNDFVYTLECVSSDGNDCSDVKTKTSLPLKNQSILIGNRMKSEVTHSYTLTLWYLDNGENQSDDMNKTLDVRINIEDIRRLENPYKDNTNSLAYNIINNSLTATNGTQLMGYPLSKITEAAKLQKTFIYNPETAIIETKPADEIVFEFKELFYADSYKGLYNSPSTANTFEEVVNHYVFNQWDGWEGYVTGYDSSNSTLSVATLEPIVEGIVDMSVSSDDYGTSYYYRGNVQDNYVDFAGMCWRIVRIQGDGTTKLILEDQDNECTNSDGNWNIPASNGTSITMNGEEPYTTGNFGYETLSNLLTLPSKIMNYINPQTDKDRAMVNAFKYFQTNLNTNISTKYSNKTLSDYLISGNWCFDDSTSLTIEERYKHYNGDGNEFIYKSYYRIFDDKTPSFKCEGTKLNKFNDNTNMYVGTLTADEILYSGQGIDNGLPSNYGNEGDYYYLYEQGGLDKEFWTLTPVTWDWYSIDGPGGVFFAEFILDSTISGPFREVDHNTLSFRPSIILKAGIEIVNGGNGTKTNPYVIK